MAFTNTGAVKERILENLAILTVRVKLNTASGRTDINHEAEDFYCGLLNAAFGWKLGNLNALQMNFAAIDLADSENRLAIQVTSTEGRKKVQDTLDRFFEKQLEKDYDRLIVLIIGEKPNFRGAFALDGELDFDANRDIWDTETLSQKLEALPEERLAAVDAYLRKELPNYQAETPPPALTLPLPNSLGKGFVGRQTEMEKMARMLPDGPVVLWGLGGIGKSQLAAEFCRKHGKGQSYFVRFRGNLLDTVLNGICLTQPDMKDLKLDSEQARQEAYEKTMALLRRCGREDILIIDNVDKPDRDLAALKQDPVYQELRKTPLKLILTTRNEVDRGLQVKPMKEETLYDIFRYHQVPIGEDVVALIKAVKRHTMTIDLFARAMKNNSWKRVTAEDLLEALRGKKLGKKVATDHNESAEQLEVYEHLEALFDVVQVPKEAQRVLRWAALLPTGGLDSEVFGRAVPEELQPRIDELISQGWLLLEQENLAIHPVIGSVCRNKLNPNDENCEDFLWAVRGQYDEKQYNANRFRQFAELFTQAAELLPDGEGDWASLAGYFWKKVGQPGRALELEEQAVAKLEAQGENGNQKELATCYNNLGYTYGELGNHPKALEYMLKALAIRETVLPENHPELATSYNNVGSTYGDLGDHRKALEYKLKALTIFEKALPPEHPDLASSYDNVGGTYGDLGDHQKALEYKLKALKIRETVLPENHPDLAQSYNNVGLTYGDLGDHRKALEYMLKAMKIQEKVMDPEHPLMAACYNNVGYTYGQLGDHQKELEYMLKALKIRETVLPENHPELATSYNNVGSTYGHLGDHRKALEYQLKAMEIQEKVMDPNHPLMAACYNNVGYTYGQLGNHRKELEYKLKALKIQETVLSADHPYLMSSCHNVAVTYFLLEQYEPALEYEERALAIARARGSAKAEGYQKGVEALKTWIT